MNQQRPADAQKYFEQSLATDPNFEVARLNLGISLLAQQKLEPARIDPATGSLGIRAPDQTGVDRDA